MPGFGTLAPGADDDNELMRAYYDPMTGLKVGGPDRYEPPPKPRTWRMEPDLAGTLQGGTPDVGGENPYPPGSEESDYFETSRLAGPVVRRPGVLPIVKTPEGYDWAMPKIADVAQYLVGGPVPGVKAGEMVLGAGMARAKRATAAGAKAIEDTPPPPPSGAPSPAGTPSNAFTQGTGSMPQLAERYPETVEPTLKYKTTSKPVPANEIPTGDELTRRLALPKTDPQAVFQGKAESPEAGQLAKLRKQMKPDIEAGNYEPYFPPEQRADIDPTIHGDYHDTSQNLMKTQATRDQYDLMANNPDAVARLNEAYQRGLQQKDMAGNWYFMKQLQDEFVNEYGPLMGPRLFKERFADAMAATTGGADPTGNLLMAHFGNYLKARGLPVPEAHQFPYPIGGQYAANNMAQFRKMIMEGEGIDPLTNEKRYNFAGNFLGRNSPATIDEQMSSLWAPGGETPPAGLERFKTIFQKGMEKPPPGAYGHFEQVIQALAAHHNVDPRFLQEVAWAGIKDINTPGGYVAKPMISHVNDAIERTHRVTGMPRAEIVRRGLVRGEIPIYGTGGGGVASSMARDDQRRE